MQKIKDLLNNLATQLLAFQQKIIENGGIPTEKELQFQVKTINAMAKLEKMIARDAAIKARELKEQQKQFKLAPIPAQPPVSLQDFDEYSDFVCSRQELDISETVTFRGKQVNAWWLEYNLFQYMLPAKERRFLHSLDLIHTLDYLPYRQQMFDFISSSAAA